MTFPALSTLLPHLREDKANHFIYGVVLFILLAFIRSPEIALAIVVAVGIAKEIYDKYSETGTPDIWDAVATTAGGAAGYLCVWLGTRA